MHTGDCSCHAPDVSPQLAARPSKAEMDNDWRRHDGQMVPAAKALNPGLQPVTQDGILMGGLRVGKLGVFVPNMTNQFTSRILPAPTFSVRCHSVKLCAWQEHWHAGPEIYISRKANAMALSRGRSESDSTKAG